MHRPKLRGFWRFASVAVSLLSIARHTLPGIGGQGSRPIEGHPFGGHRGPPFHPTGRQAFPPVLDRVGPVAYIVVSMPIDGPLGEFEVVILMAVLHLVRTNGDAFGSAIREEIERRSGRKVSRGSVYITLDRLEEKGLLRSRTGEPSTSRGDRPKRLFRVTPAGLKALKHSMTLLARMHAGLEPVLGGL